MSTLFIVTKLVFIATTVELSIHHVTARICVAYWWSLVMLAPSRVCALPSPQALHLKAFTSSPSPQDLQQPTIARWLELAGPYLDSSSYIYHLLDQQQEQGEELHIQFFLAG